MMQARIQTLRAREILDSRGHPTVEVTVVCSDGTLTSASVPSGASTGQFEAAELRDGDASRYGGKGVLAACRNVTEVIAPRLRGMSVIHQQDIDARMTELDGTPNKSRLGANALLGVSHACARAAALSRNLPLYRSIRETFELPFDDVQLPEPMLNIINGGRHADNGLDFQEYHIVPHGSTFAKQLQIGSEVVSALAEVLRIRNLSTLVGDEGGFAPTVGSNQEPLNLILEAVDRTPYRAGNTLHCALDVAASEFYIAEASNYWLKRDERHLNADDLMVYYEELLRAYPIISIEDPFADVDEDGWERGTQRLGKSVTLVGDDLFVTNAERLTQGVRKGLANAVIIKPNQVGTLTETIETVRLAQAHAYTPIVSHRSGETTDDFIADLAVAVRAPYIKAGSVTRGERLAKYNRLLAIEQTAQ